MSHNFSGEFTRSLLEKIGGNSATLVLDSGGICVFASSATENVLQIPVDDLQGKNFLEAIKLFTLENKSVDQTQHPVSKALSHKDFTQSTPFFCKLSPGYGSETLALSTIQILGDQENSIEYVVVQIRKATREVEVGEMKSLFVSFAAHQLKTPSSVVKGFLELMMRQGEAAYSKDQWHFLTSAFESNEQLIEVSRTLLNMARLEGGLIEPNLREFDPSRALQGKIATFGPLYQTKRLTVNFGATDETGQGVSGPLQLRSDETFFLEIFGIIFGNAIKHSLTGGEIKVSCIVSRSNCEVHVIDNGSGISEEIRASLFKDQQDSGDGQNSHGLGLYMAKKYAAILGGSIGLADANSEHSGSDFYFIVPNLPA